MRHLRRHLRPTLLLLVALGCGCGSSPRGACNPEPPLGTLSAAELDGRFYFGAVFGDRIGVWRPTE